MDRLSEEHDINAGQSEHPGRGRGRGGRGARGDTAKRTGLEGRIRAQTHGGCQAERRQKDGRGGEGMRGRGSGGNPGSRGEGKERRSGIRGMLQERGKGRGAASAGKECKIDPGRQRGGARSESKDGAGGEGVRGRGKGRGAGEEGKGCKIDPGRQRGGAGSESKDGIGGEELKERCRGKGGGAAEERKECKFDAGRQGGGTRKRGGEKGRRNGEGVEGEIGRASSNGEQGAAEGKGVRKKVAEMGVTRRGGHSEDRIWSKRRDGVGCKKERNDGRSDFKGRLGYKQLEELSGKDPSVVAITLASQPALQDILRETTMREDLVELLCRVLSEAFKSRTVKSILQHLAGMMKDSGFFHTVLPHYLAGIESEFNPARRAKYPQHMENILAILSQVNSMFPASRVQALSLLHTQLQASINSLKTSGVEIHSHMEDSMESLKGVIRHRQQRSREVDIELQDFRSIPLYPTAEELHQDQKPVLRPNLTSQSYANTHLYLDTHFRLLREDFIQPLRDGIQKLHWYQVNIGRGDKPLKNERFGDIRIYFDTKVLMPKCTHTGLSYIVQFDIKPLQFVCWQNSKRLIYGSLVLLSFDYFESFLLATVSDSNPIDLRKGQVQIKFTEASRLKLAQLQMDQLFLMVETTAYFEAYRHVLDGLKELDEDSLPFQRYIVECNTDMQPPAYLRRGDTYDLSCIADQKYKKSLLPFQCLKEKAWPGMEKLGLDKSQMSALKLALTNELAIIQGPPGTGKTYIGLKIAQALLKNQGLWSNYFGAAPILVVCYTNHALDQFLEGIYKFLKKGIVRVGGRSDSEILKLFNLTELVNSPVFKRSLPSHLRQAYKEIFTQLADEERKIQSHIKGLVGSLRQVLPESEIQMFMSDRHLKNLQQHASHVEQNAQDVCDVPSEKKPSPVIEWLCLSPTAPLQRETEIANGQEDIAAADAMEMEEEDLIEITEKADLIQEEQIIEDSIDRRVDRQGRKKGKAVRELGELMLDLSLDEAQIQAEQSTEVWEMQQEQRKKRNKLIMKKLVGNSFMTEEEESAVLDIWTLSLTDRWRLYRLWVSRYRAVLFARVQESEEAYQNTVDRVALMRQQERLRVLRQAKVIGMTTTGAAKYRKMLQEVRPCVMIVEEAAEVLEAHTITSLSQTCQHVILIGDHQQLRPSTTVYELAKDFHMDISMFERLVKMGLPFVKLILQHRMRPEIARLLTPHIYSELENHPSVFEYENIKGLITNVFFVSHCHPEEAIKDGTSHLNKHEAMFVVSLCRYLLLQGYKPNQVTILTTYTGQLNFLSTLMRANEFKGVQVYVVDKYQGEENDIVLLSLVRSNPQGKVGFLSISNRVCVALSRAKKGLYCIGNSAVLRQVKLWRNIFDTLREKDQVGDALILRCQNHPDRQVKVSCAEDFIQAPEGGCARHCNFHLNCGHVCVKFCHPCDPEHKEYTCAEKCQILCGLGHACPYLCHDCPKECPVKVEKIIPQCQHKQMVPCHEDPNYFTCQRPCRKMLVCGHPCESLCGEECYDKCNVKVTSK